MGMVAEVAAMGMVVKVLLAAVGLLRAEIVGGLAVGLALVKVPLACVGAVSKVLLAVGLLRAEIVGGLAVGLALVKVPLACVGAVTEVLLAVGLLRAEIVGGLALVKVALACVGTVSEVLLAVGFLCAEIVGGLAVVEVALACVGAVAEVFLAAVRPICSEVVIGLAVGLALVEALLAAVGAVSEVLLAVGLLRSEIVVIALRAGHVGLHAAHARAALRRIGSARRASAILPVEPVCILFAHMCFLRHGNVPRLERASFARRSAQSLRRRSGRFPAPMRSRQKRCARQCAFALHTVIAFSARSRLLKHAALFPRRRSPLQREAVHLSPACPISSGGRAASSSACSRSLWPVT